MTVAAGVVIGMVMCSAYPAFAAGNAKTPNRVTFGIEPASSSGADGRPHFSFGVTPGAIVNDHVAVVNYSSVPLSLQLYATDSVETSKGGFGLLPANVKPTDVGAWISLPSNLATVVVPARSVTGPGQVVEPVTVHVPDRATPGDHVGGIIASLQTVGTNASGQKVILNQRIGTRVFIRVSGVLAPHLVLTDQHVSYVGTVNPVGQGRIKVRYVVKNTGNVVLALSHQSVSVSGPIGSNHRVALANIPLLLPGATLTQSVVIPGVWPQFFVHQTETATPLPLAGTTPVPGLAPVSSTTGVWAIPWPLLAVVVLLILAAVLVRRVRARRAVRRGAVQPAVVGA